MKNITVEKVLNNEALILAHQEFNKRNECNWTLEQYKKSLDNQEYLKYLVFNDNNKIVGIVSYSTENPWNKIIIDIDYFQDKKIKKYLLNYLETELNIKKDNNV